MKRRLVAAMLLALTLVIPVAGVADARTKEIIDGGVGCQSGTITIEAIWTRKGGPVASVDWSLWQSDGTDWAIKRIYITSPDTAVHASVSFENVLPGDYSFSYDLLSSKDEVIGSYDYRPSTVSCSS